ncbi:MAG TPA: hypothetical protein VGG16_25125, partial [Streptosporangiaceae bacterium]
MEERPVDLLAHRPEPDPRFQASLGEHPVQDLLELPTASASFLLRRRCCETVSACELLAPAVGGVISAVSVLH